MKVFASAVPRTAQATIRGWVDAEGAASTVVLVGVLHALSASGRACVTR